MVFPSFIPIVFRESLDVFNELRDLFEYVIVPYYSVVGLSGHEKFLISKEDNIKWILSSIRPDDYLLKPGIHDFFMFYADELKADYVLVWDMPTYLKKGRFIFPDTLIQNRGKNMERNEEFIKMFNLTDVVIELLGKYPYLYDAYTVSIFFQNENLIWALVNPIKVEVEPYKIFFSSAEVIYNKNILSVYPPHSSIREFIEDIYELSLQNEVDENIDWSDPEFINKMREKYPRAFKEMDILDESARRIGEKMGFVIERVIEPDGITYFRIVCNISRKKIKEIAELILSSIDALRMVYASNFDVDEDMQRVSKDDKMIEEMKKLLYNGRKFVNKLINKGYRVDYVTIRNWPLEMTGLIEISTKHGDTEFVHIDLDRENREKYYLRVYLKTIPFKLDKWTEILNSLFDHIMISEDERELTCSKEFGNLIDLIKATYYLIENKL